MNDTDEHDRAVSTLVAALRARLSPGGAWTVLAGARWRPLADFPNYCSTFDVMIVPADAKLDWDESGKCFGPEMQPVTVFDVIRREDCEEEFYDKPDTLCLAGVYEYCLWDPSAEQMRPAFQAFRRRESALRLVPTSLRGVFFSAVGFRMVVRDATVELTPSGDPRTEEELFTCQRLLEEALSRASRNQAAIDGLTAKVSRLQVRLGGAG